MSVGRVELGWAGLGWETTGIVDKRVNRTMPGKTVGYGRTMDSDLVLQDARQAANGR